MNERDYELLITLDKTRNITHAAELMYTSQSALSKRITAIEKELNVNLLIRSRKGVYFTPEGELVLKYIKQVRQTLNQMHNALDSSRDIVTGLLRVGISQNYSIYRFPEILTLYHKKFPEVDIHIQTDHSRHLYTQLLEGQLDLAIIRGNYPWNGEKVLVEEENICLIKSNIHQNTPLKDINYISRKTDLVYEREIRQWMTENNLSPDKTSIHVDNLASCVELVEKGNGWAIVPEICLQKFDGVVIPIKSSSGNNMTRSTYMMYQSIVLDLDQIREFIALVKNFRKDE